MKKYNSSFLSILLSVVMVGSSFATAEASIFMGPELSSPSKFSMVCFHEEALSIPLMNWIHSFGRQNIETWHAVAQGIRFPLLSPVFPGWPSEVTLSVSATEPTKAAPQSLGWAIPAAAVTLFASTLFLLSPRKTPQRRTLLHDKVYRYFLQFHGEIPKFVRVGASLLRVRFASAKHAREVADLNLFTEYRNRKNLSQTERDLLQSRLAPGLDIHTEIKEIRANETYVQETLRRIENNPFTLLMLNDEGHVAGVVFVALAAGESADDLPPTWEEMTERHMEDINEMRRLMIDWWFTGDEKNPGIRNAMIDLSGLLKSVLRNKPQWGIMIKDLLPYSNPRAKPAFPHMDIVEYLLHVIDYAIDKNTPGAIMDPAMKFHLANGGRIVRIIENAFPQINTRTDLHHDEKAIGGGFSVVLRYPRESEVQSLQPGQVAQNLIDSREFLLRLQRERQPPVIDYSHKRIATAA